MRCTLGVVVIGFVGLLGFAGCVGDTATPTDGGADTGADASSPPDGSDAAIDAAPTPTVVGVFAGGVYQGGNTTLGNGDRSCAIVAPTGSVWCWGDNQFGELGQGTSGTDALSPTEITKDISDTPFTDVEDLALGGWHTCAKKKNGKVYCWGQDQSGAIGDNAVDPNGTKPPVTRPQPLALGSFVAMQGTSALAAGYGQSCAIDATGKVSCWGWNGPMQLGHPTTMDSPCNWMYANGTQCNGGPIAVIDNTPSFTNANIAQIATGENVSCVRTAGANVFCFGDHSWVGSGAQSPAAIELMTDAAFTQPLTNVSKIAMASKTLCALTTAQSVYCAGFDNVGQTGQSASAKYAQPVNINGAKDIAAGDSHFCAIKVDGSVWCWGYNGFGQLGNGVTDAGTTANATPVQVVGQNGQGTLTNAVSLAGGFGHSCALRSDGSVWCWGRNNHGQLGDGTATSRATPAPVQGLP